MEAMKTKPALTKRRDDRRRKRLAKRLQNEARLAAERLADRNRRWWNALRETAPSVIGARWESITENDNGMKSAVAAVLDAIASEASNGEIPDLLKL